MPFFNKRMRFFHNKHKNKLYNFSCSVSCKTLRKCTT
nr:MAG TPA: hypothetical protein [Caudoviricetes sp.]